jgi:hypothetical protein
MKFLDASTTLPEAYRFFHKKSENEKYGIERAKKVSESTLHVVWGVLYFLKKGTG